MEKKKKKRKLTISVDLKVTLLVTFSNINCSTLTISPYSIQDSYFISLDF